MIKLARTYDHTLTRVGICSKMLKVVDVYCWCSGSVLSSTLYLLSHPVNINSWLMQERRKKTEEKRKRREENVKKGEVVQKVCCSSCVA